MESKNLNIRSVLYSMPVHRLFYILICVIFIVISILGLLISFTNRYTTLVPASGGVYKVASTNNIRYIDPIFANNDTELAISELVYSGMLKKQGDKYIYDIAESMTKSTDGLSINIKLKDAKFSDGTAITSSDVVYTVELIQDSLINSPRHKDWKNIDISIVDTHNILIQLKSNIDNIEQILTQGIIKKSEWVTLPKGSLSLSNLNISSIGAGPYKLQSTLEQNKILNQINLEINNNYKSINSLPYITNIVFKIFSDKSFVYEEIKKGETYTALEVDPADLPSMLQSNRNITVSSAKMYRSFGLFFNPNNDKNLADISFRSDLRNSIDIDKIVSNVLGNYGNKASYVYNKYYDNPIANSYMINKSNHEGREVNIYTVNNPDLVKVANMIKEDWAKIGVTAQIKTLEIGEFHQDVVKNRNFSILLFAVDTYDNSDIYNLWHSSGRNYPGSNITNYYSVTLDQSLEQLTSSTVVSSEYSNLLNNINDELYRNVAWVPLYNPYMIMTSDKSLHMDMATRIYNSSEFIEYINKAYINTEKVYAVFSYDSLYKKLSDFIH